MKVERVDDNQILWSLDRDDMTENQITLIDFLMGNRRARELFRKALQQAENELSFRAEGYILNCQLQELSEECITFSITKKEMIPEKPFLICECESMEEVLEIARLLPEDMALKNTLYHFEQGYYLILEPDRSKEAELTWCTVGLTEFVDVDAVTGAQKTFIEEHGKCVIRDEALQRLRTVV